jgi:4-alpha-glucanotransferase
MAPESSSLDWLNDRAAGLLLHPTSLPGDQGVGVLGKEARQLLDFLRDAGFSYWQVLPLGPTGYGDSPYQSFSAFAGNPYLIDLQPLLENGILKGGDIQPLRELSASRTDYGALYLIKWPLLRLAYKNFCNQKRAYLPNYGLFEEFKQANAHWLEPFVAYMALKERFSGSFWGEWPRECQTLPAAMASPYWKESAADRDAHAFYQYLFFGQWALLKSYAAEQGIQVIGDAPIFVALDSADVWASPQFFEMSSPGKPDRIAGVPPDYFSATGQLWGNPLYDWKRLAADHYQWWIDRLEANFRLFDVVRLDHFRGFYDYWSIPAEAETAVSGEWRKGPRERFFKAVAKALPEARIIAEDLGDIDASVRAFRDKLRLPGMSILQFAFGGGADNLYLPHNLEPRSVLYPGTHDNNTTAGWYASATPQEADFVRRYLRVSGEDIAWDILRAAYAAVSRLTVIPGQDLLSLGEEARMNAPGIEQGNWQWRLGMADIDRLQVHVPYLKDLAAMYGRLPQPRTDA